jgi:hypothetical protein
VSDPFVSYTKGTQSDESMFSNHGERGMEVVGCDGVGKSGDIVCSKLNYKSTKRRGHGGRRKGKRRREVSKAKQAEVR